MEDPQEDPLVVHCFCVCSDSALLGDLAVSRSMERDLCLSYDFLACSRCVSSQLMLLFVLYSTICSCALVLI